MSTSDEARALQALANVIENKDADSVEDALGAAFAFESPAFVPLLIELIRLPWHRQHEEIARLFQVLKDPRAIDALHETAFVRLEYLAYDEFFGLARKCTWALADIGTADAKAKLVALTKVENPLIVGYAQKRLDQWEDERHRKPA